MKILPSELIINGTKWQVNEVSGAIENMGDTNGTNRTISIDINLAREIKLETLYHEIVHAILMQTGHQEHFTDEQNEALAQGIGFALMQLVRDNELPYLPEEPSV